MPWCSSFRLGQVHGRLAYRGLGQAQRHRRAADLEEREHHAEHHVEAFAVLGQARSVGIVTSFNDKGPLELPRRPSPSQGVDALTPGSLARTR